MGLSEGYFWESTPRKIIALIDQKKEIERAKIKNLAVYTACMVWGKDPDEIEKEKNAPIAGRDFPAGESALKGFFV